jgi:hypothetical protein
MITHSKGFFKSYGNFITVVLFLQNNPAMISTTSGRIDPG